MNVPMKTLAALLVTASIPLIASQAAAAPTGQSLALSNVDMSTVEQVQSRRRVWRNGRWVYLASPYAAYGRAPARSPRYRSDPCVGDAQYNSAYPSWMCRPFPRETDWNRW